MDRKLFGFLGPMHVTAIIIAALFVPSVLYGVTAFTNVALEDPNSGARAAIDSTGRLTTVLPFSTLASTGNFQNSGTTYLTSSTTAQIAITKFLIAESRLNGTINGSDLYIQLEQVSSTNGMCGTSSVRTLAAMTLGSDDRVDLVPASSPLIVGPSGGAPYCIALVSLIDTGGTDSTPHFPQYIFDALVVSGTYTGQGAAPSAAAKPAALATSSKR